MNVLSYYAIGNSLDGQPMIERPNVLRFYPVYALRDYIDTVRVTIYYGPHIFTRNADPYDGQRYWQVLLPKFVLGEAIQRIEVETSMDLSQHPLVVRYQTLLDSLQRQLKEVQDGLKSTASEIQEAVRGISNNAGQALGAYRIAVDATRKPGELVTVTFPPVNRGNEPSIQTLICNLQVLCKKLSESSLCVDSLLRAQLPPLTEQLRKLSMGEIEKDVTLVPDLTVVDSTCRSELLEQAATTLIRIDSSIDRYQNLLADTVAKIVQENMGGSDALLTTFTTAYDSLRSLIAAESYDQLTDTMFAGPGVRKGDVILMMVGRIVRARILYRNYKTTLRNLPALDPAERLGIFRLRYVPFVVRGKDYTTPFSSTSTAVFEVGLGFSNVAISGDDFVIPDLSLRRLGIAFAVTSKLFSDEATIRALVVTYDFNAYGSIGIGANFPGQRSKPGDVQPLYQSYISFGINKLAFEQLLVGLSGLLNRE